MWIFAVLTLASLLTAAVSAVLGMAGGILLLGVLFSFLSHGQAIPTHAAVQLVSNSTRVAVFRAHVDWRTVARFLIGAVPGGAIGVGLLWLLGPPQESEPYLKMVVGAYILLATVGLRLSVNRLGSGAWWDFPLLGVVAGTAALTVGAVGPLIAPLFARHRFAKERLIATKAACQVLLHIGKIPAFIWIRSFDAETVVHLGALAACMAAAAIPGTLIGRYVLGNVSEKTFIRLYQGALTFAGLKVFVIDGLYRALGG